MRSLATRQSNLALSKNVQSAVDILKSANFDFIILETSGIGQSDTEIVDHSNVSLYVMTPEYGAASQLEKIDMLDFADVIAINKFDKKGALDAIRDVRKQYQRNHQLWETPSDDMPVIGTIASQFNDPGMNNLYKLLMKTIIEKTGAKLSSDTILTEGMSEKIYIIPPSRTRYLSEITDNNRNNSKWVLKQSEIARTLFSIHNTIQAIKEQKLDHKEQLLAELDKTYKETELKLDGSCKKLIEEWESKKSQYAADNYVYHVRDKEIKLPTYTTSLSHTRIAKVV